MVCDCAMCIYMQVRAIRTSSRSRTRCGSSAKRSRQRPWVSARPGMWSRGWSSDQFPVLCCQPPTSMPAIRAGGETETKGGWDNYEGGVGLHYQITPDTQASHTSALTLSFCSPVSSHTHDICNIESDLGDTERSLRLICKIYLRFKGSALLWQLVVASC